MTSQMNLVQNAARLAMADHRAAMPRRPRPVDRTTPLLWLLAAALATACAVWIGLA